MTPEREAGASSIPGLADAIAGFEARRDTLLPLLSARRAELPLRYWRQAAHFTTPAADADVVATEWGVAELRGIDYAERARRLAAIAHPQHREALERAALRGFSVSA